MGAYEITSKPRGPIAVPISSSQADARNELRDALGGLSRNVRRRLPTSVPDSLQDDKAAMVHGEPRNLIVIDVDQPLWLPGTHRVAGYAAVFGSTASRSIVFSRGLHLFSPFEGRAN
jgi:hypothetical protein